MKKKILFGVVMACISMTAAFAQKATFSIQGQERPDLEDRYKAVWMAAAKAEQNSSFTFEDIQFWVGEGSKRAALVIDWNSDKKDHALVWGYRFDGEATGYDMLAAVAKADPRFVLLKEESIYGATVGGIAYTEHLTDPLRLLYNDSVYVPVDGVVTADSSNYGDWSCSDAAALWQGEHWSVGYWSYYVKDRAEDTFGYAATGVSGRTLTDGCVDGLSFVFSDQTDGGLPRMPYEFVEPYTSVGNEEKQPALYMQVYPNPTDGQAKVEVAEDVLMEVFDLNGRMLMRRQVHAGLETLSLERSGIYFVRLSSAGRVAVKRLVRL